VVGRSNSQLLSLMLRTTSFGPGQRTNSFPAHGGRQGSVAVRKHVNLDSDLE
jgi:hypothetical protein